MNINFTDYFYYPTLRTRQAELKGLQELDSEIKKNIIPILTLGEWPRSQDAIRSIEKSNESMENLPFIADITSDFKYLKNDTSKLIDPTNAFSNWRELIEKHENIIPVIQFSSSSRDFIQQVLKFERNNKKIVFRIKDFLAETQYVINALNAMQDPNNALILIDCQYIRGALPSYSAACVSTINIIRSAFPQAVICVLSTSFPSSVIDFCSDTTRTNGNIEIQEHDLFERVSGSNDVAIYGDHASIHSVVYDTDSMVRKIVPRIDYPTEKSWHFERRSQNDFAASYIDCAETLIRKFPEIELGTSWGEKMITETASGDIYAKAAAPWISVRVNIHLTKQYYYNKNKKSIPLEEEEDDELDF